MTTEDRDEFIKSLNLLRRCARRIIVFNAISIPILLVLASLELWRGKTSFGILVMSLQVLAIYQLWFQKFRVLPQCDLRERWVRHAAEAT